VLDVERLANRVLLFRRCRHVVRIRWVDEAPIVMGDILPSGGSLTLLSIDATKDD
jgi:hypothetical protein